MNRKPPRGLFIAGVDTEIGKTYVAALIARQLTGEGRKVGVYKPAASGAETDAEGNLVWRDPEQLRAAAGGTADPEWVCPQRFRAPLAPHLAAAAEGKQLDPQLLRDGLAKWNDQCDVVVVEGAGGLMSPISEDDYIADLAYEFGYPVVIVAANRLGVINHTLQTLITAAAFRDGLPVAGVVLNSISADADASRQSNATQLRQRCGCPLLAELAFESRRFEPSVDWWSLASAPAT